MKGQSAGLKGKDLLKLHSLFRHQLWACIPLKPTSEALASNPRGTDGKGALQLFALSSTRDKGLPGPQKYLKQWLSGQFLEVLGLFVYILLGSR